MIDIPAEIRNQAIKEVIAKGLAIMILVAWVVFLTWQNISLSKKIDKIQGQMFDLQNQVIRENTKALYEFNLTQKDGIRRTY